MSSIENKGLNSIPFFYIIGRPRSGTTLLQLFFDAHPNVQIPSECMYISQLWPHYRHIYVWDETEINNFIIDLKNTWLFTPDKFDLDKIKEELTRHAKDLRAPLAFKIVAQNYKSIYTKKDIQILGDKNPLYSQTLGKIVPIFPHAKYIFILRDPRDNHISLFNSRFTAPSITYDTLYWKKAIDKIEILKKFIPKRVYILKYEDFVISPEKYLTEMCLFLEIPFSPEMLKYRERKTENFEKVVFISEEYFKANHTSLLEPVNTSKIGIWKTRLPKKSIRKVERVAGKYLDKYGYERFEKSPGIWSIFSTIPGKLFYFFIEKGFTIILKFLPKKLQLKLVQNIHIPYKILWRIFAKKGQKL